MVMQYGYAYAYSYSYSYSYSYVYFFKAYILIYIRSIIMFLTHSL